MSTLAVFDLDHTLIAADSSLLWTDYLWEKGIITDPAFLAADKQMMADYSAGKLDMAAYMAFSLKALGNATVAQIDEWVADFMDFRQFLPERTIFYTDSANDLPLCRYATDVLTVNADPVLKAEAEKLGWMQLTWSLDTINS